MISSNAWQDAVRALFALCLDWGLYETCIQTTLTKIILAHVVICSEACVLFNARIEKKKKEDGSKIYPVKGKKIVIHLDSCYKLKRQPVRVYKE